MIHTARHPDWLQLWEKAANPPPFCHPAYAALFENPHTMARAAIVPVTGGHILYPFLLRKLAPETNLPVAMGEMYDIITPYGYGGPMFAPNDNNRNPSEEEKAAGFRAFYDAFAQWARNSNVVSEFVRFSLFSEARPHYYGLTERNNENIVVRLNVPAEALWAGFKHKVRKNVKTAMEHDVRISEDPRGERLDDFLNVYYHTMKRRGAPPSYHFPKTFFMELIRNMPGQAVFFHAICAGRVVASELVLHASGRAYSFLGGTLKQDFHRRPSDLVKHHIILWAREQGQRDFIIGGGHRPHDGIFAFKKSFAPNGILPFYVGKHVFNKNAYRELIRLSGKDNAGGFFPAYRTP